MGFQLFLYKLKLFHRTLHGGTVDSAVALQQKGPPGFTNLNLGPFCMFFPCVREFSLDILATCYSPNS